MRTTLTLFALLAATTGLASAAEYFTISTNFGNNTVPTTDFGGADDIVTGDTRVSWLLSSFQEDQAVTTGGWGKNEKNLVSPNNVGKGEELMLTFHNTVDVKSPFDITAISFTYIVATEDGDIVTDSLERSVQWSVAITSLDGTTLLQKTTSETITMSGGWRTTKNVEFNLDETDFATITGDYVVTIWAHNPNLTDLDLSNDMSGALELIEQQADAYYGLKTISFAAETIDQPAEGPNQNVPEPTTATLSLLGLAGLAARRRRQQ